MPNLGPTVHEVAEALIINNLRKIEELQDEIRLARHRLKNPIYRTMLQAELIATKAEPFQPKSLPDYQSSKETPLIPDSYKTKMPEICFNKSPHAFYWIGNTPALNVGYYQVGLNHEQQWTACFIMNNNPNNNISFNADSFEDCCNKCADHWNSIHKQ